MATLKMLPWLTAGMLLFSGCTSSMEQEPFNREADHQRFQDEISKINVEAEVQRIKKQYDATVENIKNHRLKVAYVYCAGCMYGGQNARYWTSESVDREQELEKQGFYFDDKYIIYYDPNREYQIVAVYNDGGTEHTVYHTETYFDERGMEYFQFQNYNHDYGDHATYNEERVYFKGSLLIKYIHDTYEHNGKTLQKSLAGYKGRKIGTHTEPYRSVLTEDSVRYGSFGQGVYDQMVKLGLVRPGQ
ncbi:MAG: hypothetical protein OEV94_10525 [Deltaproteobacteria bacterium]|nr:hypothetical protein [Deltaproteobacteria bacterium]